MNRRTTLALALAVGTALAGMVALLDSDRESSRAATGSPVPTGAAAAVTDSTASAALDVAPVPGPAPAAQPGAQDQALDDDALAEQEGPGGFPEVDPRVEPDALPVPQDDPDDGNGAQPLAPAGCEALADGVALLVGPDPLALEPGDDDGHLTITNCTDHDVDWSSATKPSVALDTEASTLPAGASTLLGFTIDFGAWEPGTIEFKIKVSEPGHNHYIDVDAFRHTVGTDLLPGGIELTAGPGAGGCADQCITKALLGSGSPFSPDVHLDVATNVRARIKVWVSQQPPVEHADGHPYFPGKQPLARSLSFRKEWDATLSPLAPATSYHIVVAATDTSGHTAYRAGEFTTITPYDVPDALQSGDTAGCSVQCVTSAVVDGDVHNRTATLSVESHTPASYAVWLSTAAIGTDDVAGLTPVATSGGERSTAWHAGLGDLDYDTTYHVVLRATDEQGRHAFQLGTFHTSDEPAYDVLVTVHSIRVSYDGDRGINRGEISFRWGFDGAVHGSRGEDKITSESTVSFKRPVAQEVVFGATGYLPVVHVVAAERDADGLNEFCSIGTGLATEPGSNKECDLKWNVAKTGLIGVDALDGLPRCSAFGVEGYESSACVVIETPDRGDDYARFSTVISYTIID